LTSHAYFCNRLPETDAAEIEIDTFSSGILKIIEISGCVPKDNKMNGAKNPTQKILTPCLSNSKETTIKKGDLTFDFDSTIIRVALERLSNTPL
jgi:hypothetical protein